MFDRFQTTEDAKNFASKPICTDFPVPGDVNIHMNSASVIIFHTCKQLRLTILLDSEAGILYCLSLLILCGTRFLLYVYDHYSCDNSMRTPPLAIFLVEAVERLLPKPLPCLASLAVQKNAL